MKDKTIAYVYLFNYFGGDKYGGKTVVGVSVDLAVRCYKGDSEIKFAEGDEPEADDIALQDVFGMYPDAISGIRIEADPDFMLPFFKKYGWNGIEYDITGYFFDLIKDPADPDDTIADTVEVDEATFMDFAKSHFEDLDISDNYPAQVPGIKYI